jgi:hypothetical protein
MGVKTRSSLVPALLLFRPGMYVTVTVYVQSDRVNMQIEGLVGFPVMITEGHMTLPRTRSGQLPYILYFKSTWPPRRQGKTGEGKKEAPHLKC